MFLDTFMASPMFIPCHSTAPESPIPEKSSIQSESKMKESLVLAWRGFQLLSKKIEAFLDGTPFKTPVAVLNVLIDLGNVRWSL